MTKSKKKQKSKRKPAPLPPKRRRPILIPLIAAAAVAAALLFYTFRSNGPEKEAVSSTEQAKSPAPVITEKTADFRELVGRWVRPDGGYVIEIRSIGAGGHMDAGYFNPRPIHVSRAEASLKGDIPQVFIELQGKGYPGSTYTLLYNREQKVFVGTYYQAAMGRNFEVIFVRQE
ncbi:MAG: hypothetical protein JRK53_17730 [Deltaproteobacteria bacterium]|nr:hypothetical protein [Deltaproteobacteria bacterium]MBW1817512.1 hypothetical protein [Deltaproteobacteria bacterium]